MLWLMCGALAADNVRAVAAQPVSLADLDGARALRVDWDGPGVVELDTGRGFKPVADATSPWVSPAVSRGARVRVDGVEVPVVWGVDAQGVARLVAPAALPGVEVADVVATDAGAWVALLDGGVVFVDKRHFQVQSYGVAEGLPSVQANALAVDGDGIWVGTAAGVLAPSGRLYTVDDGLPDDWVQVVHVAQDTVYVGTYAGLATVHADAVTPLLSPRSVFSVTAGSDARDWVGYEGLRGLPDGEPLEGMDPALNVWDVDTHVPGRILIATDSEGLLLLQDGVLSSYFNPRGDAVYALERSDGLLWAAADQAGLIGISDTDGPVQAWGRAEGLPSDVVYEVVAGPHGSLWVGTDHGLALLRPATGVSANWPVSPAAAGIAARAVLARDDWALIGTDQGVASIGTVPRRYRDALGLPGPVVAVVEQDKTVWVVTQDAAYRVQKPGLRGAGLERYPLPAPATGAVASGATLWVASESGLFRHDGRGLFVPGPVPEPILDSAMDPSGLLWASTPGRIVAVDPAGNVRDYLEASRATRLAVDAQAVWLVKAVGGLQRMDPWTGEVTDVAGFDDPGILDVAAGPGGAVALLDDLRVVRVPSGLPVTGVPELWTLGEVLTLEVDAAGRVWVQGDRGSAVIPL